MIQLSNTKVWAEPLLLNISRIRKNGTKMMQGTTVGKKKRIRKNSL